MLQNDYTNDLPGKQGFFRAKAEAAFLIFGPGLLPGKKPAVFAVFLPIYGADIALPACLPEEPADPFARFAQAAGKFFIAGAKIRLVFCGHDLAV